METFTRRSVLRGSAGLLAATTLTRPHIANAAATTASMWLAQGFIPEEDAAYKAMVADYQQASGNTIDYSIIPFAALRQKAVSAVATGVVPDIMEIADFQFLYLNAWKNNLLDVTEVFETQKAHYGENALACAFAYNNEAKKRSYYEVPWKSAAVPFHVWKSLVEKSGQKVVVGGAGTYPGLFGQRSSDESHISLELGARVYAGGAPKSGYRDCGVAQGARLSCL